MELTKLSSLPKGESITGLIYGRPKTGKTVFAATAGKENVIINTGRGEEAIKSAWFKKYNGSDPFIINFKEEFDPKAGTSLGKAFDRVSDTIDDLIKNNRKDFNCITIDDMTFTQTMAMDKALIFNQITGKSQTLANVVKQHDVIVPAIQDYGSAMSITKQFLDYYCNAAKEHGFHFLVLAHEKDTFIKSKQGESATVDTILPYFTGDKLPYEIAGIFDWVVRTEIVGGGTATAFQIRTVGNEKLMAGIRHAGLFPEIIRNPNFLKMVECVKTNTPLK